MDNIIIYPKNEQQKSLLKSLLEEMKVRFEIGGSDDSTILSETEFFSKIDKSVEQADSGITKILTRDQQKKLLGL